MGDSSGHQRDRVVDRAELEARGLYDPAAPDAQERLALLDYLLAEGVTAAELEQAAGEGRLVSVLGDRVIRPGPPEFTIEQAAAGSGFAPEVLLRLWRATGLPPPVTGAPAYSEADVEVLSVVRAGVESFGLDAMLQLARVMGSSLARIAEAETQTAMLHVEDAFFPTASSAIASARTSAELGVMLIGAARALDVLHRHHVEAALRRFDATLPPDATSAHSLDIVIGFADLVGFSSLAERLELRSFAEAVAEFGATSSDIVTGGGGRVVKLIGDEVMFVAPDSTRGTTIALELVDAFVTHHVLSPVRGALAAGRVVGCDGDYFGSVVNVAARLIHLAEANTVLVTEAVAATLAGDLFRLESLGGKVLRGVDAPVATYRVQHSRP